MKTLFVRKSFIISLSILIAAAIALGTLAGFVSESQSALNPDMPTIVVDAGHGGIDNGVTGVITGNDEADINLAISRYLKGQFTSAGFNCVMTRTTQSGLYGNTSSGFKKRDMEARKKVITDCDADMLLPASFAQGRNGVLRQVERILRLARRKHTERAQLDG